MSRYSVTSVEPEKILVHQNIYYSGICRRQLIMNQRQFRWIPNWRLRRNSSEIKQSLMTRKSFIRLCSSEEWDLRISWFLQCSGESVDLIAGLGTIVRIFTSLSIFEQLFHNRSYENYTLEQFLADSLGSKQKRGHANNHFLTESSSWTLVVEYSELKFHLKCDSKSTFSLDSDSFRQLLRWSSSLKSEQTPTWNHQVSLNSGEILKERSEGSQENPVRHSISLQTTDSPKL
jgi:hypothetical protein